MLSQAKKPMADPPPSVGGIDPYESQNCLIIK